MKRMRIVGPDMRQDFIASAVQDLECLWGCQIAVVDGVVMKQIAV